ncbi:hypothetical protein FB451DRAFT_1437157 [Mycena latifolia]|nr:hypothetical protein FB451DRAFT_1437157 [Mycena latifolia]
MRTATHGLPSSIISTAFIRRFPPLSFTKLLHSPSSAGILISRYFCVHRFIPNARDSFRRDTNGQLERTVSRGPYKQRVLARTQRVFLMHEDHIRVVPEHRTRIHPALPRALFTGARSNEGPYRPRAPALAPALTSPLGRHLTELGARIAALNGAAADVRAYVASLRVRSLLSPAHDATPSRVEDVPYTTDADARRPAAHMDDLPALEPVGKAEESHRLARAYGDVLSSWGAGP